MKLAPETNAALTAAVQFFANDIDAARIAVARHVKADDGSCAGCQTQRDRIGYPCIVALLASEALRLTGAPPIPHQRTGSPALPGTRGRAA